MDKILHYLRTLNYGNYGIFLIMGHAGFCPSTVGLKIAEAGRHVGFLRGWFVFFGIGVVACDV